LSRRLKQSHDFQALEITPRDGYAYICRHTETKHKTEVANLVNPSLKFTCFPILWVWLFILYWKTCLNDNRVTKLFLNQVASLDLSSLSICFLWFVDALGLLPGGSKSCT